MAGQATSLKELRNTLRRPQQIIHAHTEAMIQGGGQPIQMPQVVKRAVVAQPVQQVQPVQQPQQQTITSPKIVPPKKGGCGCWGNK